MLIDLVHASRFDINNACVITSMKELEFVIEHVCDYILLSKHKEDSYFIDSNVHETDDLVISCISSQIKDAVDIRAIVFDLKVFAELLENKLSFFVDLSNLIDNWPLTQAQCVYIAWNKINNKNIDLSKESDFDLGLADTLVQLHELSKTGILNYIN